MPKDPRLLTTEVAALVEEVFLGLHHQIILVEIQIILAGIEVSEEEEVDGRFPIVVEGVEVEIFGEITVPGGNIYRCWPI